MQSACAWASAVGSVCSSIIQAPLPAEVRAGCQAVVGGDNHNVIKSISQYFSNGLSKDTSKIDQLSKDVSAFLMQVRADAKDITASLQQN